MTSTPEAIVRAMAKNPMPVDTGEPAEAGVCVLCVARDALHTAAHHSDCPWRLAREWVAQHPEEKT